MSELDDLLSEMLAEAASYGQPIEKTNNNNNNNNNKAKITFQEQMPSSSNGNSNTSTSTPTTTSINNEKRKSRLSQHHSNNEGGFDYLDTLLNDMSDESIRNSIKPDTRIKSLRLTSTFDLESTLKDLEETFMKDSAIQNKRKPSSYLSKNLSSPPQPNSPPPSATSLPLPPPTPTPVTISEQPAQTETTTIRNTTSPILKRVSSERAIILTKEAIDAADLLDEMIESFGGNVNSNNNDNPQIDLSNLNTAPPPAVIPQQPIVQTRPSTNNLNLNKSPNNLTIRPAAKLGAPVDIQISSPKAPTPIPTLSSPSPPVSPTFKDSDQLLDDMISHFKENNSNLISQTNGSSSNLDPSAKVTYISQQHYPLSVDEQNLTSKIKVVTSVDEDIVSRILGDNDLDENHSLMVGSGDRSSTSSSNSSSSNAQQSIADQLLEKSWYIKAQPSDTIGVGNNGTTQRSGIHKDKRIVLKSWNFITPQATPMLFNEIEQLVAIKHPNILPLIGASFEQTFTTYTEYITGSNLDVVLKNLDEKNELQLIIRLSEEIASAMAFLHSFNIVHRSLHPKNILLNSDLKIYIKDFGFTSLKDETLKKKLNSIPLKSQLLHQQYLAPELFNVLSGGSKGGYDTKVDVFAFGVLLWEMFAREHHVGKLSDLKGTIINGYTHYLRPSLANCPFTIEKLIRLCLSTDPNVRPSFTTILKVLRQPLHTIQRFNKPTTVAAATTTTAAVEQSTIDEQNTVDEKIKSEFGNIGRKPVNESLDKEKRDKIVRISNVVKDLIDQPTLLNLQRASSTIESLCKNVENIDYLLDTDFIPLIFQLMDQQYDDIQLSCLKQFSILIEHNQEINHLFRNLLGINILMETLTSTNESIIFATLKLLSQISSDSNEENRQQVLDKGGIPILINMLSNNNELIRLQVIWCITMLLESQSVQNEFVKLGGVDQLLDMIVHSDNSGFDLRIASALSRVISLKSVQDQINSSPYRERLIRKYLCLLNDNNFEALRMLGLEAIACLVSNRDNQLILTENQDQGNDVVSMLYEYLDPNSTVIAPQMTALKIILVLSVNQSHIPYLKSTNIIDPLKQLSSSPHPSIQKAVEKILLLVSK